MFSIFKKHRIHWGFTSLLDFKWQHYRTFQAAPPSMRPLQQLCISTISFSFFLRFTYKTNEFIKLMTHSEWLVGHVSSVWIFTCKEHVKYLETKIDEWKRKIVIICYYYLQMFYFVCNWSKSTAIRMWNILRWPIILMKKIILFPLKLFVFLDITVLIVYFGILFFVFCSAEGFQWCSDTFCTKWNNNSQKLNYTFVEYWTQTKW